MKLQIHVVALVFAQSLLTAVPLFGEGPLKDVQAKEAYESGRFKEAIGMYRQLVDTAPPELKGEWLSKLALAYYRDQDDVSAFSTYLDALESVIPGKEPVVTEAEQKLYSEAMAIYLDPTHSNPRDAAIKIRQEYGPVVSVHDDYYQLGFFVAASYANLGMFDEFFGRFFHSFQAFPKSYFAYKGRGVLHIKLFERLTDPVKRELERERALESMVKARDLNPKDTVIYKLLIAFARPDEKAAAVRENIPRIIAENTKVSRADIHFYIQEAVAADETELAKQFLDKAKEWYPYSKSINSAQEILDSKTLKTR